MARGREVEKPVVRERVAIRWDLAPVVVLVVMGLVFIHSAGYPSTLNQGADPVATVLKQAAFAGIGLLGLFALMYAPYERLSALAWPALLVCVAGLCLVWAPYIGIKSGGASRWIGYGWFRIQPSEFTKVAFVLYLAAYVSRKGYPIRDLTRGVLTPVGVMAGICLLIEREPDLGTALIVFAAGFSMLYVAGAQPKHLAGIFGVFALGGLIVVALAGHRSDRIPAFLAPEENMQGSGYQITHSLIAVSSGGLSGRGFGLGQGKYYLPAASTDYIMSTVAEETGLWGVVLVFGCLAYLVGRAFRVAASGENRFARLVATGIGATIMWQSLLNLAVATNSIPSTGVPMPFISSGGSSLVAMLAMVGILMSPEQSAPRSRS